MTKRDIKSLLLPEFTEYFASIGEKAFRARQVFLWLHRGVETFGEMTDIPEQLRVRLGTEFFISVPELLVKQESKLDGTVKYLWGMPDGAAVESVLMEYEHGSTVCISTQVGCRMGCLFCASATGGLIRNLTASEMENQVLYVQRDSGKRISNVVLMGTGEPLDNFDNVLRFLQLVIHPSGLNIGARHITVSTCGIIENIDKLADYSIQLTITVSLHAPDDETRMKLMPVSRSCCVDDLLETCGRYFHRTGRRVSYEYALIADINDTKSHAQLLADKLKNTGSHVNIILLNNVAEHENIIKPSSQENVRVFTGILSQNGINYTIRRRLGGDIDAACGQLRGRYGTLGTN